MNMSLYFSNLSEDEIIKILEVVSVPYLMEPLKGNPEKYLAGKKNMQSLSREAVNHIYLQFLKQQDPVLSLYLSDIVVDIIHYFKLSDAFKNLLVTDDPNFVDELKKKIKQRQCPITVDMFMRLLDRKHKKKAPKKEEPVKEAKFFNVEEEIKQEEVVEVVEPKVIETVQPEVEVQQEQPIQEAKFFDVEEVETQPQPQIEEEPVQEAKFFDIEEETKKVEEVQPLVEEPEIDEVEEESEVIEEDQDDMIRDLQYQIMNLQMENQSLKEENRNLLFETEDESEMELLRHEVNSLKDEKARLKKDVTELSMSNTNLQNELRDYEEHKKKHNQVLLELRDYKIKYISLQAEVDQLRYTMKNDSKKLKELQNKQRSVYDNQSDWMMAMHDLTWYKKQWNLPGDAPIHKIWAHLNHEEAKGLAHLIKNFDRLLRTERKKEIDNLKEILIVKEAILILLRSDKAMENAKDKA